MLTDKNNTSLSPPSPEESSKNDDSPLAGFTIANTSVNTGISLGSLLFSIVTFAYTYLKDQREKKDKEKWEKEMKDQIRILEERVNRLATLRGAPHGRGQP